MSRPTSVSFAKQAVLAQHAVDAWNAEHPARTRVTYIKDDGSTFDTWTRHAATVLGGHTAVAWLEGVSGCVALDRVIAIPEVFVLKGTLDDGRDFAVRVNGDPGMAQETRDALAAAIRVAYQAAEQGLL